jgi:hypothetical protein
MNEIIVGITVLICLATFLYLLFGLLWEVIGDK